MIIDPYGLASNLFRVAIYVPVSIDFFVSVIPCPSCTLLMDERIMLQLFYLISGLVFCLDLFMSSTTVYVYHGDGVRR